MNRNMSVIALLASTILTTPAFAQQNNDVVLEEIIVTAQKKSENIQNVPIAITAITGEQLESKGIRSLDEVAFRAPNLSFRNTSDIKLSPISVRGVIANTGSAGQDPSVATYVDEIFLGSGAGANIAYYDLEAVEILRGPQGTLFGRNAIGGVINIRTRRPTFDTEGYVEGELGNFSHVRAGGALGGALVGDVLAARVSASFERRDGFSKYALLNTDGDDENNWNLRGQLLLKPSESSEFLLSVEYREVQQSSRAFDTLVDRFGVNPDNINPNDRVIFADDRSKENFEGYRIALRGNVEIGSANLTSVTGYRNHEYDSRTDTDNTPLKLVYDGDPETVKAFSQELRLAGGDDNLTFSWLIGGFYYNQKSTNLSFVEFGPDLLGAPITIIGGSDAAVKVTSYAGFASVTARPIPKLSLTLGGRFTREAKSIVYKQDDPLDLLGGTFAVNGTKKYSNFSPNLNVSFKASDDVLLYAAASRGFKSGGFNDALGEATGIGFEPEKVDSVEAGIKSEIFDRRLRLNLAAFYLKWKDILISVDNPATPVFDPTLRNAGKARSFGLEAEATFQATERLSMNASVALLNARFTGSPEERKIGERKDDDGNVIGDILLDRLPDAPKFKLSAAFTYRAPIGNSLFVAFSPELTYSGAFFLGLDNELFVKNSADIRQSDLNRQGGFALINGSLSLDDGEDGSWSLGVWVKNLTNKRYKGRVFDLSNGAIGQVFQVLGPPLTIGVSAKRDF
jgi:iron complex outermembrane recepter protein